MGMDYRYAGSASYPRYEEEITQVAAVFGGKETAELQEHHAKCLEEPLGYWFGYMYPKEGDTTPKFMFPSGTPDIIIRWLDFPYDDRTPEETAAIWEEVRKHHEIKDISYQIWRELKILAKAGEGWHIT